MFLASYRSKKKQQQNNEDMMEKKESEHINTREETTRVDHDKTALDPAHLHITIQNNTHTALPPC
eukprot:m.267891 g.267891  ORF g.267891 m.267891 type:complete len:65 (-) comp15646_c0_seq3:12-206(-)